MVPFTQVQLVPGEDYEDIQTSRTYRLDLEEKRIIGYVDGFDAIKQAVEKIMLTQRYAYVIYDYTYGIELDEFIGKSYGYVEADIQRACSEALLEDDRIVSVKDFRLQKTSIDTMTISFLVETVAGITEISWEVVI